MASEREYYDEGMQLIGEQRKQKIVYSLALYSSKFWLAAYVRAIVRKDYKPKVKPRKVHIGS